MKKLIPLILLLLFIAAVIVIVGGRSTHSGNHALVSHHPEPVVVAEGPSVSETGVTGLSAASAEPAAAVAEVKTTKPRHRGVYRPRRSAAKTVVHDWVRIPGTGIALWPKPKG